MQLVKTFSVLALATGAVVAMPAHVENGQLAKRQWWGGNRFWQRPNPTAEITVTGYAPEPTGAWVTETSTSTSTSTTTTATTTSTSTTTTVEVVVTATPAANNNYGGYFNRPTPEESTPTEAPAAPETPSPSPAPQTPASSAPAPAQTASTGSSQDDYMSVVSQWRAAGGLPALTQDSTLEANALKTSTNSVGGLIHELNPGTMAQVLAPGTPSNFESVYVGGWLCEIPTLPGLDGICSTEAQGWDHSDGETGHAEILTSTSYSKIGCALSSNTGVWACDLA